MARIDVDIVIVGAGFAGAATAYHLARQGQTSVLLLEKEAQPGVHSSGRNAAIVREHVDDPAIRPFMEAGAAVLRQGHLATFEPRGVMLLGRGDQRGNQPVNQQQNQQQDVGAHFPRAVGTGLWCPQDGTVDIAGLLRSYLADRRISFNTTVLGSEEVDNALRVETSEGTILCRLLVNAAGPWAGTLGGLPLTPMNRHLFVTGPVDWVKPDWPCVWDMNLGLYFRPEADGLLLCCCDETQAAPGDYDQDPPVQDSTVQQPPGQDRPAHEAPALEPPVQERPLQQPPVLDQLAEKLATSQPGLGDLSIRRKWVGQRVFAPDRRFTIGFDPRCNRLFHVAALGGHGVTASHEVGRLAASLITGHAAGLITSHTTKDAETLNPTTPLDAAKLDPARPFDPARLLPNPLLTK